MPEPTRCARCGALLDVEWSTGHRPGCPDPRPVLPRWRVVVVRVLLRLTRLLLGVLLALTARRRRLRRGAVEFFLTVPRATTRRPSYAPTIRSADDETE